MSAKKMKSTVWLTGRPCAGKTTLSVKLREELDKQNVHSVNLDGDDVRGRLNKDLGFSEKDRKENLRRVAHVAQLFNENGIFVIATFITPLNVLRQMVRGIIENFSLCYVNCSPAVCELRDVKGMYKKARRGEIRDFTGVSAPFEIPLNPEIIVDTEHHDVDTCVNHILEILRL